MEGSGFRARISMLSRTVSEGLKELWSPNELPTESRGAALSAGSFVDDRIQYHQILRCTMKMIVVDMVTVRMR